ncbi:hypothetical protein NEUTE2DRAFT_71255 [Neurospora tetrasperma FGSC 2509]|nr:hypothetical protein NEUTE2DRAFT_71255 [Neurospora tetrasperma FGSC 2509]
MAEGELSPAAQTELQGTTFGPDPALRIDAYTLKVCIERLSEQWGEVRITEPFSKNRAFPLFYPKGGGGGSQQVHL